MEDMKEEHDGTLKLTSGVRASPFAFPVLHFPSLISDKLNRIFRPLLGHKDEQGFSPTATKKGTDGEYPFSEIESLGAFVPLTKSFKGILVVKRKRFRHRRRKKSWGVGMHPRQDVIGFGSESGSKVKWKRGCVPRGVREEVSGWEWSKFDESHGLTRREDWEGLPIESTVCDHHTYFFEWGPRRFYHDWVRDEVVERVEMQQRVQASERKRQVAALEAASWAYHNCHREGQPVAGQLPNATLSSPLSPTLGDRIITIVTTACLPWLTGTSINPLLRAAYLEQHHRVKVVVLFPYIPIEQQRMVYPNDLTFETEEKQAAYVKTWIEHRLNIKTHFRVRFYPAEYDPRKKSIFPIVGDDITRLIADSEADVAVLEEPEHLCWYHFSHRWRSKFKLVVGVAHTNYIEYIRREPLYSWFAEPIKLYNMAVVRANCHRVIRLSDGVQNFCSSVVSNVHGVSPQFLQHGSGSGLSNLSSGSHDSLEPIPDEVHEGQVAASEDVPTKVQKEEKDDKEGEGESGVVFTKGCYFIGKVVWSKGYRELCDLLLAHCQRYGWPQDMTPGAPQVDMSAHDVAGNADVDGTRSKAGLASGEHRSGEEAGADPPSASRCSPSPLHEIVEVHDKEIDQKSFQKAGKDDDANADADADDPFTEDIQAANRREKVWRWFLSWAGEKREGGEKEEGVKGRRGRREWMAVGKGEKVPDVCVDIYGSGFEEDDIIKFAKSHRLPMTFHGRRDHVDPSITEYKVFVNPSVSDVLCTTTAEALAMGKFVVVADHPSNYFFSENFPENCIVYDPNSPEEWSNAVLTALSSQPKPLTPQQRHLLTWEAATERFMEAAGLWPQWVEEENRWIIRRRKIVQNVLKTLRCFVREP